MRLQQYLNEGRSNTIDPALAIEIIRKGHMDAAKTYFNKGIGIFRGNVNLGSDFGFVKPSQHERQSANTSNQYTLLMDNLPQWKDYPKRSKSIICSNNLNGAYGRKSDRYLILPKDNSKIGVCSDEDLWDSFRPTFSYTMDSFNDYLYRMVSRVLGVKIENDSYPKLKKQLDTINTMMINDEIDDNTIEDNIILRAIRNNNETLWQYINYVLDPKNNYFSLVKSPSKMPQDSNREVWTDGDAVMIKYSYLQYNEKELKELILK